MHEIYDLKTGILGVTDEQIDAYMQNAPHCVLYEVKPGVGNKPIMCYHPATGPIYKQNRMAQISCLRA